MLEHYEKDKELMDAVKRVAWNDMAMLRTRRYTPLNAVEDSEQQPTQQGMPETQDTKD